MTWYYYVRKFQPLEGYWTTTPPAMCEDRYLANIDAAEMPTESPFQMQQSGIARQTKAMNPYQG